MTDKQIIIDGVDVCECSYGEIEKSIFKCSCEYNARSASMFCKDNPNCYYKQLKRKEQECERLKWYLKEIRNQELWELDIDWDEYETHCIDTEYTNIINLVEEALEERSPEDCRYEK